MRAVVSSNLQSEIRIPQSPLTLSQVERAAEGAEVDDGVAGPDRAVEVRAHRLFGWLVLAWLFPVRRRRRRAAPRAGVGVLPASGPSPLGDFTSRPPPPPAARSGRASTLPLPVLTRAGPLDPESPTPPLRHEPSTGWETRRTSTSPLSA